MTPALVVSLHDVAPRTMPLVRRALQALDALGIRRRSLLVIPAEHCGPGIDAAPGCARWLADCAAAGDEIVQHGLHHRGGDGALDWRGRWLDQLLVRGAGEFLALDAAVARRRLVEGRERLESAGLAAAGFIAPGWMYNPAAVEALAAEGFRYYATHLRLRDLATGRDHWSFGLSNRPGALGPDLVGRAVNEVLCLAERPLPLLRVAVHPADLEHSRPFRHTLHLLRRVLATGRQPTTYLDYLDQEGAWR